MQIGSWRQKSFAALAAGRERGKTCFGAGVDLLFPPTCAACHASLDGAAQGLMLCEICRRQLVDSHPTCGKCGKDVPETLRGQLSCPHCEGIPLRFNTVVRLGQYQDLLRTAVLRTKRPSEQPLAMALGDLLAMVRHEDLAALAADVVVPIPMHWTRRMWRGFNNPEVVADRLARQLSIRTAGHLLRRSRRTRPQANLSPLQRFKNVRKAFRAVPDPKLRGARVLLVDDILTTGATCSSAARALLDAGASYVAVAVLARAEGPG